MLCTARCLPRPAAGGARPSAAVAAAGRAGSGAGGSLVEPPSGGILEKCGAAGAAIALMTARSRRGTSRGSGSGGSSGSSSTRRSSGGEGGRYKFALGTRVRHVFRGNGVVTELMADGRTRVKFDDGDEHRYQRSSLHKLKMVAPPPPEPTPAPTTAAEPAEAVNFLSFVQSVGGTCGAVPAPAASASGEASLVSTPQMLLCQEDDWASCGETSPAGSSPGGVGGAAAARGVGTARGDIAKPSPEQIAARRAARRASLKSADSCGSLFGHKDRPGRQVSEKRESALMSARKTAEERRSKSSGGDRGSGSSSSSTGGGSTPSSSRCSGDSPPLQPRNTPFPFKGRGVAALNSVDEASTYREQAEGPGDGLDDRLSSFLAAVHGASCTAEGSTGKPSADDRLTSFIAAVPGASCTAEGYSGNSRTSPSSSGGSVLGATHRTVSKATARPGTAAIRV